MYSSGYSQVNKHSPQGNKKMQYHSKGKSCGYYMRIVFFFSSLIQSLIIVSLVLFLIYGKDQDSASLAHIQDLEESFSRLSIENVDLRLQRKNLTTLLNSTLTEKARNDWDLTQFREIANISLFMIQNLEKKLRESSLELSTCILRSVPHSPRLTSQPGVSDCGFLAEQLKARLVYVETNFTHTTQKMRSEMDQMARDRDNLNLQAISLRKDKSKHQKELESCRTDCKSVLQLSLKGISNVTSAFLKKIDSLSSTIPEFHLTCPKQREHLEQIRSNCTNLSREMEGKFQHYLKSMGEQVSNIQSENGRLKAENWRLSEDYYSCSQNRSGLIQQHRQNLDYLQQKHDRTMERVLLDKRNLNGEITVLNNSVNFKNAQIAHLTHRLKELNTTCMYKTASCGSSGGSRTSMSGTGWGLSSGSQPSRTGLTSSFSSSASTLNKPASTGTASLSSSLFSTGSGSNKPGSSGGASSFMGSAGSNPSQSSSGTGSNKSSLFGRSSSTSGSSTGVNPSSSTSGTGSNKATVNAKSSTSSGSASSTSKSGSSSSGLSWFSFGSSSSTQSKSGSGTGNGPSGGNSYSGTGLSSGAGRSNGQGAGQPVSVAQHIQNLQRLINPPGPEEKQDLSRVMG